jgi:hypothetical protein
MAAELAVRQGGAGNPIVAETAVHIEVSGATANEADGTEKRFYILVDAPPGVDDGRSHVFQVSADGDHTWDNYIFPAAGSYTVRLRDMADDSDAATESVTVAAA